MSSARSPEKCCLGDARPAHLWRFPLQNLLCPECGDEFALQSQLAVHMEAHRQELAGARPHTCKACKKEFGASSELKEHMKAHCKIRYAPSWSSGAPGSWRSRGLPAASHVKGFSAVAAGSHTADASQHGSARGFLGSGRRDGGAGPSGQCGPLAWPREPHTRRWLFVLGAGQVCEGAFDDTRSRTCVCQAHVSASLSPHTVL